MSAEKFDRLIEQFVIPCAMAEDATHTLVMRFETSVTLVQGVMDGDLFALDPLTYINSGLAVASMWLVGLRDSPDESLYRDVMDRLAVLGD